MHKHKNMSGSGFQCKYCFQKWQKKESMEKHSLLCGFWHRSSQVHDDDYETTPTVTELFKLVKEFAYKCDKLQKRVDQLENRHAVREKKQILEYLHDLVPSITMVDLVRTFVITQSHLENVFEMDLTAGIKSCIKYNIDHFHSITTNMLPICGFTQKQNVLYIYDIINHKEMNPNTNTDIPQWHIITNVEMDKIISILSLKFLQAFMAWKKTNFPDMSTPIYDIDEECDGNAAASKQLVNEQIKNQHQTYMIKINGQRINEDKRRNEIKQMLYAYLQKSLPTVIELV